MRLHGELDDIDSTALRFDVDVARSTSNRSKSVTRCAHRTLYGQRAEF